MIDKVWVISASTSFERRKIIKNRLDELGIDFEFYISGPLPIFNTLHELLKLKFTSNVHIQHPNEIAATLAHLNCIQISKSLGHKNILIFEDDTLIRNSFKSLLEEYFKELPDNWNVAYLVCNVQIPQLPSNNNKYWSKTTGSTLACAYIINENFYDTILNYYENNYDVIDVCYFKLQPFHNFYRSSKILAYPNPKIESSIDPTQKIINASEDFNSISSDFS
jgi:GR25 family glycosyltransferase involved in LPS biosynthesis